MSDILILGTDPVSDAGKEFFLHVTDWWIQVTDVLDNVMEGEAPLDEWFVRECMFCPRTPWLNEEEAIFLSSLLKNKIEEGSMERGLEKYFREDALMMEYFDGDEDALQDSMQERMGQIRQFAKFLSECGGCRVKWHGMDDDE